MYLSYLMGAENITDTDLTDLNVIIVEKKDDSDRTLKIPENILNQYIELIKTKLDNGFWNEVVGENDIAFIFKFKNSSIKEYRLSSENEHEIARLCAEFTNQTVDKNVNVYKYISENSFYHDFMIKHYLGMIQR